MPGIGLARLRKEGLASLRSPPGGGFVVTQVLQCPGGRLLLNADATAGQVRVRLTDYQRQPLPGFAAASASIGGDGVGREVRWQGRGTEELAGRELRREFELQGVVDLYGFCFAD